MFRWAIAIACAACAGSRPQIAPPPVASDTVNVQLDQELTPPTWHAKPRGQKRDYDLYESASGTATSPQAILIHDAGGDRRELGPLAHYLARHGVRVIVPAVDHDDPDFYGVVDAIGLHLREAGEHPTVLVGHGAGGYVAARMAVQNHPVVGCIVLAPAVPQRLAGQSIGYAGDDTTRTVQLDVEHATGRCTSDASETTFGMTRNYRTRTKLGGTTYCGVLGSTSCAARCGAAPGSNTSEAAFEAIARVITSWTSNSTIADADLLAATPTTKEVHEKHGQDGSDEWATIGMFWELGSSTRDEPMTDKRGALGLRLDYHSWPTFENLPKFARTPGLARRIGLGGYAEVAWQNDERTNDDFRAGAGIALGTGEGSSHFALALGANALLGQTGFAFGIDATAHISEFFAVRAGTTFDGPRAWHGSVMVTIPWQVIAIVIPFVM